MRKRGRSPPAEFTGSEDAVAWSRAGRGTGSDGGSMERSDFEGFQCVRSLLQQFADLLQRTQVAVLHLVHAALREGPFRLDEAGKQR